MTFFIDHLHIPIVIKIIKIKRYYVPKLGYLKPLHPKKKLTMYAYYEYNVARALVTNNTLIIGSV